MRSTSTRLQHDIRDCCYKRSYEVLGTLVHRTSYEVKYYTRIIVFYVPASPQALLPVLLYYCCMRRNCSCPLLSVLQILLYMSHVCNVQPDRPCHQSISKCALHLLPRRRDELQNAQDIAMPLADEGCGSRSCYTLESVALLQLTDQ